MRTILFSFLFAALCSSLVSCDNTVKSVRTPTEYAAARQATTIIHDTIVVSKTDSHVCGATTKAGKPCKKRTKTAFCHLHSK
jgi:hypothetical protein